MQKKNTFHYQSMNNRLNTKDKLSLFLCMILPGGGGYFQGREGGREGGRGGGGQREEGGG